MGQCVCTCVHVCVLAQRERDRQWRSAVTAGVSKWPQESQRMLLLPQLADGLRSLIWLAQHQKQMAYSWLWLAAAAGKCRSCDSYGPVSLSPFLSQRWVCVCVVCVRTSVWEAAVFTNVFPFPPPQGWPVCVSERKKERKEGWMLFRQLQCKTVASLPPSLPFRRLIGGSTDTAKESTKSPHSHGQFPCTCDSSELTPAKRQTMWWTK